eukprot:9569384-Ditylum_brightwellii.AAC.1
MFFNPVVAVKKVETVTETAVNANENGVEKVASKSYQCMHVLFQLNTSCNLLTVNTLNRCKAMNSIRSRERGVNQRYRGTEMNKAQQCYHKIHGVMNTIDHYLKDMMEVCEGDLDANGKNNEPADYWAFRDGLSTQNAAMRKTSSDAGAATKASINPARYKHGCP